MMRLTVLYTAGWLIVVVAGKLHHPAATAIAAIAVVFVLHGAWLIGHQQGWNDANGRRVPDDAEVP